MAGTQYRPFLVRLLHFRFPLCLCGIEGGRLGVEDGLRLRDLRPQRLALGFLIWRGQLDFRLLVMSLPMSKVNDLVLVIVEEGQHSVKIFLGEGVELVVMALS